MKFVNANNSEQGMLTVHQQAGVGQTRTGTRPTQRTVLMLTNSQGQPLLDKSWGVRTSFNAIVKELREEGWTIEGSARQEDEVAA